MWIHENSFSLPQQSCYSLQNRYNYDGNQWLVLTGLFGLQLQHRKQDSEICISHLSLVLEHQRTLMLWLVWQWNQTCASWTGRETPAPEPFSCNCALCEDAYNASQTNAAVSIPGMATIPQPPENQHLFAPLHTNPLMKFTLLHACRPIKKGRNCKLMIPRQLIPRGCRTNLTNSCLEISSQEKKNLHH